MNICETKQKLKCRIILVKEVQKNLHMAFSACFKREHCFVHMLLLSNCYVVMQLVWILQYNCVLTNPYIPCIWSEILKWWNRIYSKKTFQVNIVIILPLAVKAWKSRWFRHKLKSMVSNLFNKVLQNPLII